MFYKKGALCQMVLVKDQSVSFGTERQIMLLGTFLLA
jgi:hypothetical protein